MSDGKDTPLILDPLVRAAAEEFDASLIEWTLSMSVVERLRACSNTSATLSRLRDAASKDS